MGSSDFSLVNISFIKKLCYWFEFGLFCDSKATFIWIWILFQSCEYFQHPFKHWAKKMKSQKMIINDLSLGRCPKVGGAGARRLQNKNQAASDSDPRIPTLTKSTTWHEIHKLWLRKKTWRLKYWILIQGVLSNISVHDVQGVPKNALSECCWSHSALAQSHPLCLEINFLVVSYSDY